MWSKQAYPKYFLNNKHPSILDVYAIFWRVNTFSASGVILDACAKV